MKKNILFSLVYALALIITLVNTVFSLKNYLFADINDLPHGEWIAQEVSPTGDKSVDVYLVKNSLGTAVRGELNFVSGESKNIFWQTGISEVNISWLGDDVIFFNNVPISGDGESSYDCRRGTSLFTDGALEDERLRN